MIPLESPLLERGGAARAQPARGGSGRITPPACVPLRSPHGNDAVVGKVHNRTETLERRRSLRGDATPAERLLCAALRKSRLGGRKFRRQHGIGAYVVDFYCPAERLAVELDGSAHDSADAQRADGVRTDYLARRAIRVLRFANDDVRTNLEGVLTVIGAAFRED